MSEEAKSKAVHNALGGLAASFGFGKVYKNWLIDKVSDNPEYYYKIYQDDDESSTTEQVYQIKNAFTRGKWLNTYHLPLFGNISKPFFYTMTTDVNNWIAGNTSNTSSPVTDSSSGFVDVIDETAKNLFNFISSPVAFTEQTLIQTPKWNIKKGKENDTLKVDFMLLNEHNEQNTFRNYVFLQNFYSGTMPVAMYKSVMQAPNIYQVYLPGMGYYMWATINIQVENVGRQRVLTNLNKKLIKEYKINLIEQDKTLWPEAWKLSVTIKNLMPISFTTFAFALSTKPEQVLRVKRINSQSNNWSDNIDFEGFKDSEITKKTLDEEFNKATWENKKQKK